ncbi:uncharacterized protein FOMMEDRAFT_28080 [Fomitiporia mediterranea MF3/22]|uniref:uncharacterized protein n=1 Tax=Fomitiporia mediterranea (strain MF3/22) TaxID=694068 RepID=UPI000440782D|nr:uncharacterized protein FOMMEDRAFT_28080 [Fomitiporia mediterranea MF3/22]EJD04361.1 hypothetical protein FOMMEDRAFT_28080 [Fomitiporia mediterranea MF3/22]
MSKSYHISMKEEGRKRGIKRGVRGSFKGEIIELSDSDDAGPVAGPSVRTVPKAFDNRHSDPFLSSPEKHTASTSELVVQETDTDSESESGGQPHYAPKNVKSPWMRRTVITDSEDEFEADIDAAIADINNRKAAKDNDDGALLVMNDPPPSRKPVLRDGSPSKAKAKRPLVSPLVHATPSGGLSITADPSPVQTPVLPRPKGTPDKQTKLHDFFSPGGKRVAIDGVEGDSVIGIPTTMAEPATPARAKRKTKKAMQEEKRAQLATYAQALFDELNASVFKRGLPKETPLIWNNRLLATAGRAKWHKDSKGIETTCIELATKVLDCEAEPSQERIRNTLSHEMCHLACWVINRNPKENHGREWKAWVNKVMQKRPDISISTKHSYDITYKYEWQCQTPSCRKIYGRHSNSINVETSVCGICKVGDLVPLFKTRARKTKAISKMEADKTQGSPVLSARRPTNVETPTRSPFKPIQHNGVIAITLDSDSEHGGETGAGTDTDESIVPTQKHQPNADVKEKSASSIDTSKDLHIPAKESMDAEDVRKLVTHLSFIDLTND